MKFERRKFSKQWPEVECAIVIVRESGSNMSIAPYVSRGTAAALILPGGACFTGVALCSPADNFVKATGRARATGRAFQAYIQCYAAEGGPFEPRCWVNLDAAEPFLAIRAILMREIQAEKDRVISTPSRHSPSRTP